VRVLIVTAQTPFVRAGAETLTDGLLRACRDAGHDVDVAAIPVRLHPPEKVLDQMVACRLLDVRQFTGDPVDRVIALRFPTYLVGHDAKVLWLLHQHRQATDMWDNPLADVPVDPLGSTIREAILAVDRAELSRIEPRFAISAGVAARLRATTGLDAEVLHPPLPEADRCWSADPEPFVFVPSRITRMKRQWLLIEALARTTSGARLVLGGVPDSVEERDLVAGTIERLDLGDRVELAGAISDEEKRSLYARCAAVPFIPIDEDYGYVTLEAMASAKPVITCADSGGPLDFVVDGHTGAVVPPDADELARAIDRYVGDLPHAREVGAAGRERLASLDLSWSRTVETLLR
jgi:glycosyltransferase involved in cell wall biosynthesis